MKTNKRLIAPATVLFGSMVAAVAFAMPASAYQPNAGPQVLGTSAGTTASAAGTTASAAGTTASAAGTTASAAGTTASAAGTTAATGLAFTGGAVVGVGALGGLLLVGGTAMVVASKRRKADA